MPRRKSNSEAVSDSIGRARTARDLLDSLQRHASLHGHFRAAAAHRRGLEWIRSMALPTELAEVAAAAAADKPSAVETMERMWCEARSAARAGIHPDEVVWLVQLCRSRFAEWCLGDRWTSECGLKPSEWLAMRKMWLVETARCQGKLDQIDLIPLSQILGEFHPPAGEPAPRASGAQIMELVGHVAGR